MLLVCLDNVLLLGSLSPDKGKELDSLISYVEATCLSARKLFISSHASSMASGSHLTSWPCRIQILSQMNPGGAETSVR